MGCQWNLPLGQLWALCFLMHHDVNKPCPLIWLSYFRHSAFPNIMIGVSRMMSQIIPSSLKLCVLCVFSECQENLPGSSIFALSSLRICILGLETGMQRKLGKVGSCVVERTYNTVHTAQWIILEVSKDWTLHARKTKLLRWGEDEVSARSPSCHPTIDILATFSWRPGSLS